MVTTGVKTNHSGLSGSEGLSVRPPAEADVAWFNVQMQQVAPRPSYNEAQISPISQASTALQKHSERATRDLQRAARSVDPLQALQANRSLSSFYLESLLSAKLVSKAVQSVEKLTTLQ
ncbi:EscI/YscI/HrpB family type III secretion system inner rod protein [Pseudomonas chlororaphis]|uniref:EscI/YscI/HrpB family type III secretion system inner rod protein n=1 Tax=Pseudomonas chlororaphis TaxID=587753 RepID=UPI000F5874C1|nr:EscI/YscI/HrpB family type III secretion system inner rod protein [Pseudomonas chlororaphis]AZC83989.1 HrpB [Pseudomonas chlororaphis subsp. piscium]